MCARSTIRSSSTCSSDGRLKTNILPFAPALNRILDNICYFGRIPPCESQVVRPACICFYTNGVKLVCEGSPALLGLRLLQGMGVRLVACRSLEHFQMVDKVAVGEVGGINDIVALLAGADSVVTV